VLQCGDCLIELNDLRLESFSGASGKEQLLLAVDALLQEQRQRSSAVTTGGTGTSVGLRLLFWRHTGATHAAKTSGAVRLAALQWQLHARVSKALQC
jgi:hypothetical protein